MRSLLETRSKSNIEQNAASCLPKFSVGQVICQPDARRSVCVFITAGPIIKLCAGGGGGQ
jgi:hypothetical protein